MYQILPLDEPSRPVSILPKPAPAPDYRRYFLLFTALFTIARMGLAAAVELGNDEAYYWLYTRQLQWNYFDHPPLVALWGRIFTANLLLEQFELFVRMSSIVSCAVASWFLFRAVAQVHSERAGWYAAVLYQTSLYAGIVAGVLIMPDTPQMVFYTLAIWMLARLTADDRSWSNWIFFGVAAGLCIMSKVHGVFLWLGLGAYVVLHHRRWLSRPGLWVALGCTLLLVSPILFWNIAHDFATYRFHSQRVTIAGQGVNWRQAGAEALGQLLYNNPVHVLLSGCALVWLWRKKHRHSFVTLLLWIGLPLAVLLLFVSFFRPTFPHWSGPAYVALLPVAAIYLAEKPGRALFSRWLKWAAGTALLFMVGWSVLINFYPGTYGRQQLPGWGHGDVSLDRFGWVKGGKAFADYYNEQVAKGTIAAGTPVVCATWWGAHLEYYFCRPKGIQMIGMGSLQQVHHYWWLNRQRQDAANMQQALCIVPSDELYDVAAAYAPYYGSVRLVKALVIKRSGKRAKVFWVYRLGNWRGKLPAWQAS